MEMSRTTACQGLRGLVDRIHLVSYAHAGDPLMMQHFVRHYIHKLGVLPSQMRIFLQMPQEIGNASALILETRLVLLRAGVLPNNVKVSLSKFTDIKKLTAINAFIDSLPRGSLLINADGDELFDYPCHIAHYLPNTTHKASLCTQMLDRMASSGRVEALQREPEIDIQFPLECNVRQRIHGFRSTKHVLLDPYGYAGGSRSDALPLHFVNSHDLGWGTLPKNVTKYLAGCSYLLNQPIAHYTMTTAARQLVFHKMNSWTPASNVSHESFPCKRYRHDSRRNISSCNDYAPILRWMDSGKNTQRRWCRQISPNRTSVARSHILAKALGT